MAGISSKAAGRLENKSKFNEGSELQKGEFSDGVGLELYDVKARFYDPQIGRFIQIDPLSEEADQESWSSFQYGLNNPLSNNDPDGKVWNLVIGAVVGMAVEYGTQVVGNLASGDPLSKALTNVKGGSILIAGAAGALTSGSSAFVPKGAIATVAKGVATTGMDALESAGKQYVETGDISSKQVFTDVIVNKVGGVIVGDVNSAAIKTAEKRLNRVEKIANADPTSSGRQKAVSNAQNNVAWVNAPKQVLDGVSGNTLTATAAEMQNTKQTKGSSPQPLNRNHPDATATKIKIPSFFLQ